MNSASARAWSRLLAMMVAAAVSAASYGLAAQGRGGRGAEGGVPPRAPRAAAPVDLTGYWVSLITEDWRWRMITPAKSDYTGIPVNAEGRKAADAWDPGKDEAAGNQCKAYGAPGIIRMPGRLHIAWEGDTALKMEIDAGTQTRLFRFEPPSQPAASATWQGNSAARWRTEGGRRSGAPPGCHLEVATTGFRAGYLRRNGVPYSEKAVLTESIYRLDEPNGEPLLVVITNVEDPRYLNLPLVMTTHFRREPDGSKWSPTPCVAK